MGVGAGILLLSCGAGEEPSRAAQSPVGTAQSNFQVSVPDSPVYELDVPEHDNVGTIPGSAAASGGAGTYRLDLEIPPGRREMAPEVALVYSSRGEDGIAGVGWQLSTDSRIHRCPQTVAVDDTWSRAIHLDEEDRLCLDGQRLILVTGEYGQTDSVYRKEFDDQSIARLVSGSVGELAATFVLEHKDGRKTLFGEDMEIEGLPPPVVEDGGDRAAAVFVPAGATAAHSWAIGKTVDPQGNTVQYTWTNPGSEHLLTRIRYTGKDDVPGDRRVEFEYETRPDPTSEYGVHRVRLARTRRLVGVTTWAPRNAGGPTAFVRKYRLSYDISPATGRSVLVAVRDCASATSCAPGTGFEPTTFRYQGAPASYRSRTLFSSSTRDGQHTIVADFDGDGTRDSVFLTWPRVGSGGTVVAKTLSLSTGPVIPFDPAKPVFFGFNWPSKNQDIDRDGREDLVRAGASFLEIGSWNAASGAFDARATSIPADHGFIGVADLNGDGAPDIITQTPDTPGHYSVWLQDQQPLWFSRGGSFTLAPRQTLAQLTDFDGDGRTDIFLDWSGSSGSAPTPPPEILFTQGAGRQVSFSRHRVSSLGGPTCIRCDTGPSASLTRTWVDINGDGLLDIFGQGTELWLNHGGRFVARTVANSAALSFPDHVWAGVLATDVDGDGAQELLVPTEIVHHWCILENPEDGDTLRCTNDLTNPRIQQRISLWGRNRAIYRWDAIKLRDDGFGGVTAHRTATDLEAPIHASGTADHYGDGLDDVVYKVSNQNGLNQHGEVVLTGFYLGSPLPAQGLFVARQRALKPDLLNEAVNALGYRDLFTYRPLSDWSGERPSALADAACLSPEPFYRVGPNRPHDGVHFFFASKMHVVSQHARSDGNGGMRTTCHRYQDAMFNNEGRGFLGFRQISVEEADALPNGAPDPHNRRTTTSFLQTFPFLNRVTTREVSLASDAAGTPSLESTGQAWLSNCTVGRDSARSRACFVYSTFSSETRRDPADRSELGVVSTYDTYDPEDLPFGNLSRREVHTEDARAHHVETTSWDYDYSDANEGWIDKLRTRTVTTQVLEVRSGLATPPELSEPKGVVTAYEWHPLESPAARTLYTETRQPDGGSQRQDKTTYIFPDRYGNPSEIWEAARHRRQRLTFRQWGTTATSSRGRPIRWDTSRNTRSFRPRAPFVS